MSGFGEIIVHSGTDMPVYNMPSLEDPSNALRGDYTTHNAVSGHKLPHVTPQTALAIGSVWQAVTIIAGDLAKLPIREYDTTGGHPRPVERSLTEMVLRHEPNGLQRATRFWRDVWTDYLLWNNAYIWPERRRDGTVRIHHLRSWDTYTNGNVNSTTGEHYYQTRMPVSFDPQRRTTSIPGNKIIHMEGVNPSCYPGLTTTLDVARVLLGLMLADQSYQAAFFRNGGRNGGVLEVSGVMKPQQLQELVASFRSVYESPDGFGKTLFTRMGESKFHQGSVTSASTVRDSHEATATIESTAQLFNLPIHKLTNKKKYNSKPEDNRDYIEQTLSPLQAMAVDELKAHLIPRELWWTHHLEYDNHELIKGDLFTTSQTIDVLRRNEIISPNEGRGMIGKPPRTDAGGESFDNPNTKSGVTGSPAGAEPGETESQEQMVAAIDLAPFRALLHNSLARVVPVKAKSKLDGNAKATATAEAIRDEIHVLAAVTRRQPQQIEDLIVAGLVPLFATAPDAHFDKTIERSIHTIQGTVFS